MSDDDQFALSMLLRCLGTQRDCTVSANPQTPSDDVVRNAAKVIDRLLADGSKLCELWQEGDDSESAAAVGNLQQWVDEKN